METKIIKIGNSKGVIIPSHLLKKIGSQSKIEIEEKEGGLFLKPAKKPREGWDKAFSDAIKKGQEPEEDYFEGMSNDFDQEEWTW